MTFRESRDHRRADYEQTFGAGTRSGNEKRDEILHRAGLARMEAEGRAEEKLTPQKKNGGIEGGGSSRRRKAEHKIDTEYTSGMGRKKLQWSKLHEATETKTTVGKSLKSLGGIREIKKKKGEKRRGKR